MSLKLLKWGNVWFTNARPPSYYGRDTNPIVTVWDLGEDTNIEGAIFWQYTKGNRNQLKDVSIRINTHAQGASQFTGKSSEFRVSFVDGGKTREDATSEVEPQEFRINPVVGRYVEIKFHSNYYGDKSIGKGGGDRVGLGEFVIIAR